MALFAPCLPPSARASGRGAVGSPAAPPGRRRRATGRYPSTRSRTSSPARGRRRGGLGGVEFVERGLELIPLPLQPAQPFFHQVRGVRPQPRERADRVVDLAVDRDQAVADEGGLLLESDGVLPEVVEGVPDDLLADLGQGADPPQEALTRPRSAPGGRTRPGLSPAGRRAPARPCRRARAASRPSRPSPSSTSRPART